MRRALWLGLLAGLDLLVGLLAVSILWKGHPLGWWMRPLAFFWAVVSFLFAYSTVRVFRRYEAHES